MGKVCFETPGSNRLLIDFSLMAECGVESWGKIESPGDLTIHWHVPSQAEIEFAVKLFSVQAEGAVQALSLLTDDGSGVKRDGIGKEWSDEVSRNLVLLRLSISGISVLFDPQYIPGGTLAEKEGTKASDEDVDMKDGSDMDDGGEVTDDDPKTSHRYPAGYAFKGPQDPLYIAIHELRDRIGYMLHQVHTFLTSKQEDDVACFNALYTVRSSKSTALASADASPRPTALGLLIWVSRDRYTLLIESLVCSLPTRKYLK